jgi:hypothetical protein
LADFPKELILPRFRWNGRIVQQIEVWIFLCLTISGLWVTLLFPRQNDSL